MTAARKAAAAAPAAVAEPRDRASRTKIVSVKPESALEVPAGYRQDTATIQTESGALVPLRTLLPDFGPAK